MADEAKALSISVDELSQAVERAVADVMGKHKLQAAAGLAFGPGTVIGRQLRGQVSEIQAVERAAADVTAEVQKAVGGGKVKLTPAAILGPGRIIVGFVPENFLELH
jgi:hypothetical protein